KATTSSYTATFNGYNSFNGEGFCNLNEVADGENDFTWYTSPFYDSYKEFGDTPVSFIGADGSASATGVATDLLNVGDLLATPTLVDMTTELNVDGSDIVEGNPYKYVKVGTGAKFNRGKAIISSLGSSYGIDEASTYSCGLDGNGKLTNYQILPGKFNTSAFLATVLETETCYFIQRDGMVIAKPGTKK
ncbi:hypothetical protein MHBO_004906, partial [Bonamia ostreae]